MKHAKAVPAVHGPVPVFDSASLRLEAFRIGWYLVLWAAADRLSGPMLAEIVHSTAVIWAPSCVLSLLLLRRGRLALYAAAYRGAVGWVVLSTWMTGGAISVSVETAFAILGCGAVSFALLLAAIFFRVCDPREARPVIEAAPVVANRPAPAPLMEPQQPVIEIPKAGWAPKSKPPASPEELAMRVAATTGKPATRQEPVIHAKESRAEAPTKKSSPAKAQPPILSQSPEQCQLFDFPAEMSDAQHEVYLKYLSRSVFS